MLERTTMRRRQGTAPGGGRQGGATLIFTAFFLIVLVATLGLAIEVGRLYSAQSELQKAANLAALDTARYVGGCRALPDGMTLVQYAQQRLNEQYNGQSAPTIIPSTFQTGVVTTEDGLRTLSSADSGRNSAVAFTAENTDFTPLTSLFGAVSALQATAGASNRPEATIGMGATLLGLNPPLLADLLPVNVGAAAQGDLADVSVSLAQLLDIDAGVATRQQLLETSINEALNNVGNLVSGQVAGLVQDIAGLLPADPNQASLLDLLDVAGPVGTDLKVNAGSLVNAAAQLAASRDPNAAINLPLNLSVSNIADVSAELRILEPPQFAAGPPGSANGNFFTVARNAQIGLDLSIDLANRGLLGLINLLELPLVIQGAVGEARLTEIDCASANQTFHRVTVDTDSDVLRAGVGSLTDQDGDGDREFQPGTATILAGLLTVTADTTVPAGGDADTLPDDPPFLVEDVAADLPQSQAVGDVLTTQQLLDDSLSDINLTPNVLGILPLPLGTLLQPVTNLLSGPLATALAPVLDPILDQLGLSLGTGEVQLTDLRIERPQLFCTSREDCFGDQGGS